MRNQLHTYTQKCVQDKEEMNILTLFCVNRTNNSNSMQRQELVERSTGSMLRSHFASEL